ncbi:MAG: HAD-IA family hydrolase [Phycisphaerae bacterium]
MADGRAAVCRYNAIMDIKERYQQADTLTFDCYGTLVDWRAGIETSLLSLFGDSLLPRMQEVYLAYVDTEKEVEADAVANGFKDYRQILTATAARLAEKLGVPLAAEGAARLPDLLGTWPPFADTVSALRRLKSRYRLGILSNIDRDLFSQTAQHLEVEFDFIVTAQDVQSYKPAQGHFVRMMSDHAEKEKVIHVAQSLYHDGRPANELGLAYIWINRYKDKDELGIRKDAEFADLQSLADNMGL